MTSTTKTGKDVTDSSINTMSPPQAFRGVRVDECEPPEQHLRAIHSAAVLNQHTITGDDSSFLLFDRALMIPAEVVSLVEQSAPLQNLAAAILMYNMGLSYHLEGLRMGMSWRLLQANRFYSMSYCLLSDEDLISQPELSALVMMALVNNTGHIHSYFCNFYEASICSQDLLTYYHDQSYENLLSEEESTIFIQNCTCFLHWQSLAAPAAWTQLYSISYCIPKIG